MLSAILKFKMALKGRKQLSLLLNKNCLKSLLPILGNSVLQPIQFVHYSDSTDSSKVKLSEAIKSHLEKVRKYDEFLKEQLAEYELGKEFLASMMGNKSKSMTQEEVDKAIEYLFPSRLFVPKARPLMKPPSEVFQNTKEMNFDLTGRPYHFLFYTGSPNYYQCLRDAAVMLEKLNSRKVSQIKPPEQLVLTGGKWFTAEELKKKLKENFFEIEYEKFLEVYKTLASHPLASEAEDLINNYRKPAESFKETELPTTVVCQDGVKTVTIKGIRRKTTNASVSVSHPGTGKIRINNMGLDYFNLMNCRRQVTFPLFFTDMIDSVDVEATVEGGGTTTQAGAIRIGLLQRDFRTRERKKPGREGARRSYTWLKR